MVKMVSTLVFDTIFHHFPDKERTKELEKLKDIAENRAKEIERWYKLTVGRELRMAELKKEIKEKNEKSKGLEEKIQK